MLLAFILTIFGIILGLYSNTPPLIQFNLTISQTLQAIQPVWFVNFNLFISVFDYLIIPILLPILFYLYKHNKYPELAILLLSWLSWLIVRLLKQTFDVACPVPSPYLSYLIKSFSLQVCYPSGHVFDYVSVWGTLYLLRTQITTRYVNIITFFSLTLISLVGISRVSLGAHWPTDVVGGYLFGLAWLLFLQFLYRHFQQ